MNGSVHSDPLGGKGEAVYDFFSSTWNIDCNFHLQELLMFNNVCKLFFVSVC